MKSYFLKPSEIDEDFTVALLQIFFNTSVLTCIPKLREILANFLANLTYSALYYPLIMSQTLLKSKCFMR